MILLKGIPKDINKEFLMKVKRVNLYKKNEDIYLTYLLYNPKIFFQNNSKVIYLTNYKEPSIISNFKTKLIVFSIADITKISIGDVVLINPKGEIIILYDKDSNDNAIFVTRDCNCNCIMCSQPQGDNERDIGEFNIDLIHLMDKKTKNIALTGGEPTIHPDKINNILIECKRHLPNTSIIVLTNGVSLADYNFTYALVSIKHPDITFAISLQSDSEEIHNKMMGRKVFVKTITGIYNLAKLKQKIEIRIVVTKLNYYRLEEMSEFISYNFPFVSHVAIMGLEPIGNARKNINHIWIDPYCYRKELESAVRILNRNGLAASIYNHQICLLPRTMWKFSKKSISSWKNIYLAQCEHCNYKNQCGGFFSSSASFHSNYIKPIREGIKSYNLTK